ncbi:MAG: hypothetical protein KBC66_09075 [Kiritimatiellae bacterium]|nr:hypothetical protein [Kiritimatiellia bacterium]NLD89934.1 hypothetical protein [Lentisphaerota bacterium]HOU20949.1 hypothetical protein [Kiritimatiellia bacterium]HPC18666.1 hypothetical protein [Kiritimatiellia bacterium]HQQ60643.1 hypothetical protein [Kiritimatiellia bacterium]
MTNRLRSLRLLVAAVTMLLAGGCATTDRESDLPWNMSQPWESAPTIPFGSPGSY